ncbi:aminotransferase class I/II-fold pyridoxal phosphate-dependent enzyme [Maribacter sp. PR1]|uniref:Aminotransferase class I/II-fold pyridoxal phosphate-dependent enzyme n=1 Tax=Maribacter cobaltidurans TaxID=1178778 RepID=A0ABU7IV67_9FLAO|nr:MULTISPECIES: aminotransferase class I/II-fold pyridoxal phosphate-dependent enzyme [Maribacter]MDC6389462.1 aminotransferase class I/II-fold pyridoxal phosphate-dependent enzyme [Maribacter sp. PR1]MEE1976851.1 aminotransferase class I/II-fold pyridoxal phosphate-dependent enzyme [Maribacter cobaltidurans]
MKNKLLETVYSPQNFQKEGHQLIDILTNHLDDKLYEKSGKAIHWNDPEDELEFWKEFLKNGDDNELFKTITDRTTYVHHPNCIGHQVTPTAPITALSGMISSLLNNGMAVYEMGMSPNAIERVVTDLLCKKIGWDEEARGFLTSGGTLANLTALLTARRTILKEDIWNNGIENPIGIMVSEEAHYCVDRAARIMGLGEKGIIKIPCTESFQMDIDILEKKHAEAISKGITIFAIIGSAPSTATGAFDDLESIGEFARKHGLWFHVDGAHGGAGIFSEKYKTTLKGIEQADSVVIDGHKMMMLPTITTALLLKNGIYANATFSQKADYLLTESDHEDWYNSGKRTFECTKTMMCIYWYTMLKRYGEEVFDAYVTQLYDMGNTFGEIIQNHTSFKLAVKPMANIVCFRYYDSKLTQIQLNNLNAKIRQLLLEDGEFYIVQTKLRGWHYLRVTVMNPFTTKEHFDKLLQKIITIGQKLNAQEPIIY